MSDLKHTNALNMISEEEIHFVALQFSSFKGELKEIVLPARDLEDTLEHGCGIDGSCAGFVPVHKSDLVLRPDLESFRILPWGDPEHKTARIMCDLYQEDCQTPFPGDPRGALKRMIRSMRDEFGLNWEFTIAPEMEFYLLETDSNGDYVEHDTGFYCDIAPRDKGGVFRKKMSRILDSLGIICEKNHHEGVKTKHEINFKYGSAVSIADSTLAYKQAVKHFATESGLTASFMPKPFYGHHGAGMHVHLSLQDQSQNLFYDPNADYQISEVGKSFMAGLMEHAPALAGVTNPSINSYKRLVPGWEAPVYICWALFNRSSLLRVPVSNPKARRVEIRCPDSTCNPYLAFAALLAAGLDGIRRNLNPDPPVSENVYDFTDQERRDRGIYALPGSLKEALDCLEADAILKTALGSELMESFIEVKRREWMEFSTFVHPWEILQYVNV